MPTHSSLVGRHASALPFKKGRAGAACGRRSDDFRNECTRERLTQRELRPRSRRDRCPRPEGRRRRVPAAFAPRIGSQAEDDGYLVTFVAEEATGASEVYLFDASDIVAGPVV